MKTADAIAATRELLRPIRGLLRIEEILETVHTVESQLAQAESARTQAIEAASELRKVHGEKKDAEAKVEAAKRALTEITRLRESAAQTRAQVQTDLDDLREEYATLKERMAEEEQDHIEALTSATRQLESLKADTAELEQRRAAVQDDVNRLRARLGG